MGTGNGGSVETEVWALLDADSETGDATKYLVVAALAGDEDLAEQLGAGAPAPKRPAESPGETEQPPLRAFVREITVQGFRGIGESATLQVNPYRGITVISGRNGSGKSSFAEALEYALTGTSYRWHKKSQLWQSTWRNLHAGEPASITVGFAMESDDHRTGTTATVGVDWAAGAPLDSAQRWSQVKGDKRVSVAELGWDAALGTHRPIMSYDELGGLFEEGQSALYDALNLLLGLDEISAAESRLKDAEKRLGSARKTANDARTPLVRLLDGVDDPRAATVTKLIARRPYDLDAVIATTHGTRTDQSAAITRLRALADLTVPAVTGAGPAAAETVAAELRSAIEQHAAGADAVTDAMTARSALLREALDLYAGTGEQACPVCETGVLDTGWHAAALERLAESDSATAEHQRVTARLARARSSATSYFDAVTEVEAIDGVDLPALPTYNAAAAQARNAPDALSDLPAHIETAAARLADAAAALRAEAAERADDLEDAWSPAAHAIAAWVDLETTARADDDNLRRVKDALAWLRECAGTLRERRLAPMVTQAGEIWRRMRHESNVDIGTITLAGAATRRRVVVDGTVDGVPAGALSVMSQGELHALALAMFIPRATTPSSPFRFLVLDDPIQAMDPAKIGGFLDVLVDLARTRQVIVFSHDDRLPAAIRARSIPAQLLEVKREQRSAVVITENGNPALRYVSDAEAIVRDDRVDDVVTRKAAPGLFRMAIEAAAHQRYFTDRAREGAAYQETEGAWEAAKTAQRRVALAVTGDADRDISGWKSRRRHRFPSIAIASAGTHTGAALTVDEIRDLRDTVRDILEDR